MPLWFDIFLGIVIFSTVTLVISENRHPVKALAWVLVLTCLPLVGLVLYFFFGKDNKHRRLIPDERLRQLKERSTAACVPLPHGVLEGSEAELANLLRTTNGSLLYGGNDVRIYVTFDAMLEDMLADLAAARDHIHFEFFKFENDAVGRRVEEILVRKAAEGVAVRVQYDDAANLPRRHFFERMRRAGIEVQPFLKVRLPLLSADTNYRNHRKVVVVDGRVGYLGGMNIAERYSAGVHGGDWRDTHMRVAGPAALELQTAFIVDWQFSSGRLLDADRYYPAFAGGADASDAAVLGVAGVGGAAGVDGVAGVDGAAGAEHGRGVFMQIATSGPLDEWRVIMQGIINMIASAKSYIYIESPYLIPTEPILMALRNAALAGVDVRIIIPYRGDKGIIPPLASRSYVKDVIAAGVKVFFYNGGYMHSKAIVSDDRISTVGSTNMDVRSYEQDFEINAFIYDRDVAAELRRHFLRDQANSTPVNAADWASRPWYRRYPESLARLLSPLL